MRPGARGPTRAPLLQDDVISYALAMLDEIMDTDASVAGHFVQLLVASNGTQSL